MGGQWVLNHPSYAALSQQGDSDYNTGDFRGAVEEYTQMIAINPEDPEGYSARGQAYYQLNLNRRALADLTRALQLTPPSDAPALSKAYTYLGYAFDAAGDHKAAIADFDRAITLVPTIPDRWGETANAEDGTPSAHKGRLWAYYHDGQYQRALAECNGLIAVDPYPMNIAVRGKLYAKMGDYGRALEDFYTALQRSPRLPLASELSAELLGQEHRFAEAASVVQAEAREFPTDSGIQGNVGWWQYRAGETAQAIVSDKKALALGGDQPITLYNLGLTYAVRGDWADAEPALTQALRISSASERDGALDDVRTAMLEQPRSAALRQALALLKTAKGRGH